jgi:MFS family permease
VRRIRAGIANFDASPFLFSSHNAMSTTSERSWWRGLTGYHWFVFLICSAAWFFDCLDQRLFSLARIPAVEALTINAELVEELGRQKVEEKKLTPSPELVQAEGTKEAKSQAQALGKDVTAMFLVGWGIGGLVFGALGDRYGRAKMLTITVLIYSAFTGLSYFSRTYWDFALARFLTGVGVGGVFGLAVALIAESLPNHSRSGALGWLQILSTVGNLSAGLVLWIITQLTTADVLEQGRGWRWMFLVGALPALTVVFTMKFLREPESWLRARNEGRLPQGSILTPYRDLLREKQWRRNLVIGALISSAGVIGLWAIVEYAIDIQGQVFTTHFKTQGMPEADIPAAVASAKSFAYTLQMIGAAVGMWFMTKACIMLGRKPAFLIWYVGALASTLYVFYAIETPSDANWMMPLMWFFSLGVFAGYAIYLPEIFPSRMRSTGTSFCYNLGRFAAAGGSYVSARLATDFYGAHYGFESPLRERYAAMTMCVVFLIALVTLPFAPETKGKPLPE